MSVTACAPRTENAWKAVEIPTDADFTGLWFADSSNGWLAGGGWAIDGAIVGSTRDGGRTWTFDSGVIAGGARGESFGHVHFFDTRRGCATASGGRIFVTGDGGSSWRPVRSASGGSVFDLEFLDDGMTGWAAGTDLVRTDDGGETWRFVNRSTGDTGYELANAIHFVDASRGWLVSHGGSLRRTDDGGHHWVPVTLPLPEGKRPILRDLTFVDAMNGWIAGEEGVLFHTADGGTTWERQERGVPIVRLLPDGKPARPQRDVLPELEVEPDRLALTAIAFADASHGWAVGSYADAAQSVVLGTSDGGATWRVEHTQSGEMLRSLFVLDAGHVWAAGDRARTQPQVVLRRTVSGR